ncbi:hypothetical protein K474DRAFT_1677535 [Panus rudis PR-1116 ss-1]|nr:hypothetical protein K474DRAFT_1677535 [Panus rudis PR-1116 ss-1]
MGSLPNLDQTPAGRKPSYRHIGDSEVQLHSRSRQISVLQMIQVLAWSGKPSRTTPKLHYALFRVKFNNPGDYLWYHLKRNGGVGVESSVGTIGGLIPPLPAVLSSRNVFLTPQMSIPFVVGTSTPHNLILESNFLSALPLAARVSNEDFLQGAREATLKIIHHPFIWDESRNWSLTAPGRSELNKEQIAEVEL